MIDTAALRKRILDLAIQGLLTPNVTIDEGVNSKVNNILRENEISNDIVQSDIPFEIKNNWCWIKMGWIMGIERGGSPRPIKAYITEAEDGINWIKIGDVSKDGKYIEKTKEKIKPEGEKKSRHVFPGDFLLTNSMSFGRPYISKIDGCVHDGWLILRNTEELFDMDFLYHLLSSSYAYNQFAKKASGATVDNLNIDKVADAIIPLPPIEEQKLIVEKVEEMMQYIETIANLQTRYLSDIESLKSKIIDAGIQGKLTEQLPEDGTAEELMEQIAEEKKQLIKEKKIKSSKALPEITEDEIPFTIPNNWKFVRIGDVCEFNPKNDLSDDLEVSFIPMACVTEGYNNKHSFEIRKWGEIKKGFNHFQNNDVGVAKITPCFQNRKSVVFRDLLEGYGAGTTELSIVRGYEGMICPDYLLWFFKSVYFISNGIESFTGVVGQQRIHKDYLKMCVLPLPPYLEQLRIADKINSAIAAVVNM